MITRLISAIVGLLAFAGMILAGYLAGNPFTTIIQRALVGLVGGMAAGYIAGIFAQHVIDENFMRVIDADADADLAADAVSAASGASQADEDIAEKEAKSAVDSTGADSKDRQDKEARKISREQGSPLREQTLSARAAREMIGKS